MPPSYGRQPLPGLGEGDEYEMRPPDMRLYDADQPTEVKIIDWRATCFERIGMPAWLASILATRRDIDREQVSRLVGAGATPMQVADILL